MTAGPPHFFVDRSLGRRQVPDALRAAGVSLSTLAEVCGVPLDETVSDVAWLTQAGQERWPVLMKDDRIRYRPAEREALVRSGVIAAPGPSLHIVSRGGLRAVELPAEAPA